jgi:hypothetical protein
VDVVDLSKKLYKVLRQREEDLATTLVTGAVQDWEQYKMVVGEIRGISFAVEELKALLERTNEDGEEALSS